MTLPPDWRPTIPSQHALQTLGVFALMVGTLQVSRALADQQLADEVLEQGIQNALALLGTPASGLTRPLSGETRRTCYAGPVLPF